MYLQTERLLSYILAKMENNSGENGINDEIEDMIKKSVQFYRELVSYMEIRGMQIFVDADACPVVALYDEAQTLPLPDMYGKNLTFKTGGVDGCDCAEILELSEQGKIDTTPLITHRYALADIEEAYHIFENRLDGVIKIAITR